MRNADPNDRSPAPEVERVAAELVTVTVPPPRGRRGFTHEIVSFAVIVHRIDREREGAERIVGERVHGRVQAPAGSLLLTYAEDRGALDGRLRQHRLDLFRVEADGQLVRLDHGDLDPGTDWPVLAGDSIERAHAGVYDQADDAPQEAVPLTLPPGKRPSARRPPLGALLALLLALLVACTALAGPITPVRADVRDTAAWSTTLGRGEWWPIPARVCGGALPTDYEAWSVGTGRRLGDARLFHGLHPRRILGSSYRQVVHAYVWCDPGTGHGLHERRAVPAAPSWPTVKVLAIAAELRP